MTRGPLSRIPDAPPEVPSGAPVLYPRPAARLQHERHWGNLGLLWGVFTLHGLRSAQPCPLSRTPAIITITQVL